MAELGRNSPRLRHLDLVFQEVTVDSVPMNRPWRHARGSGTRCPIATCGYVSDLDMSLEPLRIEPRTRSIEGGRFWIRRAGAESLPRWPKRSVTTQ